jgi:hypothetical protein
MSKSNKLILSEKPRGKMLVLFEEFDEMGQVFEAKAPCDLGNIPFRMLK